MKRLVLVLVLLLAFTSFSAAEQVCSNEITIQESGETVSRLELSLSPPQDYYYPEGGEYAISIPGQAANISVKDDEGDDLLKNIDESNAFYTRISFSNDETIDSSQTYTMNINYNSPRGATIYGNKAYFKQIIPLDFCDQNSAQIRFPESWNVTEAPKKASRSSNTLQFDEWSQPSIWFRSQSKLNEQVKYQSGVFNVTVPSTYQSFTRSQVEEIDKLTGEIERETGIETPEQFNLLYLPLNSSQISNEAAGQYYGGKIELKSTQLSTTSTRSFETLLHEVIHGYNAKLSEDSPDWWWEEGTAEYLTHKIMSNNGYNLSSFKTSSRTVQDTFEDCGVERAFISDWSPVEDTIVEIPYVCPADSSEEYITDRDRLGYAYSENIVSELFSDKNKRIAHVYSLMERENVKFADSRDKMNNQISFFTSQALDKDLTNFYRNKGIQVVKWKPRYERLTETRTLLNSTRDKYRYDFFTDLSKESQDIAKSFYRGNFAINGEFSKLKERIRERKEKVETFLRNYESVRGRISRLEQQTEPRLYSQHLRKLNKSIETAEKLRFKEANDKIVQVNESVSQRKDSVSDYLENAGQLESEIDSLSPFFRPFLLGTKEKLQASEQLYSNGKLEEAKQKLQEAEFRQSLIHPAGATFYLLILAIIFVSYRKASREEL